MQSVTQSQTKFTSCFPGALTVTDHVSLITLQQRHMNQRPDLIGRALLTLAQVAIPVLLMSQSSSEGNFCVVIPQHNSTSALNALTAQLRPELDRQVG